MLRFYPFNWSVDISFYITLYSFHNIICISIFSIYMETTLNHAKICALTIKHTLENSRVEAKSLYLYRIFLFWSAFVPSRCLWFFLCHLLSFRKCVDSVFKILALSLIFTNSALTCFVRKFFQVYYLDFKQLFVSTGSVPKLGKCSLSFWLFCY